MRTATIDGRMTVLSNGRHVDVESASVGRFSSHPSSVFEHWDEFVAWARSTDLTDAHTLTGTRGAPSPHPRQVFAIGLNYADHAAESGVAVPGFPPTFTKYPSAITGPDDDVTLPSENVDWEAELVVVIGRRSRDVAAADAWDHVAGLTAGQDYSERRVQMLGGMPQFSLGKSFPGFGPIGPELVTVDELQDRDDLRISCELNGEVVQSSSTRNLVFPIAELIAILSGICTLLPGDLVFTGTPGGVGMSRNPPRYLRAGDRVRTRIEGVGEMEQLCVAPTTS